MPQTRKSGFYLLIGGPFVFAVNFNKPYASSPFFGELQLFFVIYRGGGGGGGLCRR